MRNKGMLAIAAMVAIVAVGGIGFAAWTAAATINGTASTGTFGPLYWTGTPTQSTTGQAICSITPPGSVFGALTVSATNLGPNDYCWFYATLTDSPSSTLTGTLSESVAATGCSTIVYTDNVAGASIGPSTPFSYSAEVYATASQSGTCSFTVTVTGAAT